MSSRMNGKLARAAALTTAVLLACVGSAPATARVFKGNGKANKVTGTKRADVIRLGAGNDRANGRGGADRINGGPGRDVLSGSTGSDRADGGSGNDRLHGGGSADRLAGGAGSDRLDSVDGARDARVDGGSGANVCRVDAADLSVVRRCATLTVVSGSGGGGGNGPAGGEAGGEGAGGEGDAGLGLASATGLGCGSALPTCAFELAGTGADAPIGTVTGGGGAQVAAGEVLAPSPPAWTANGLYGCSSDGYLRVSIGDEQLDVPVDCTG